MVGREERGAEEDHPTLCFGAVFGYRARVGK
jgi:hypothetical protein